MLRIRELREAKGMSQDKLAREAGISSSAVYRIERREREGTPAADIATLQKLAGALDVPMRELFAVSA